MFDLHVFFMYFYVLFKTEILEFLSFWEKYNLFISLGEEGRYASLDIELLYCY